MKKVLIFLFSWVLMLMLGVGAPIMAYAADTEVNNDPICDSLDDELKAAAGCDTKGTVPDMLSIIINIVIALIATLAVVMIIYGGFVMMTSLGDAAKVAKGRRIVLYSVIGLVVAGLAYFIVHVVVNFLTNAELNG